jgi:hypothetical protein
VRKRNKKVDAAIREISQLHGLLGVTDLGGCAAESFATVACQFGWDAFSDEFIIALAREQRLDDNGFGSGV